MTTAMGAERLAYSPILSRPRLSWPGGARVALWIAPNIEHYEYLPPVRGRDPWPRSPHPDVLGYGLRDYGNRVGLWRMIAMMDRLGLKGTTSLSLSVYEMYPEIMEALESRGWDTLCHGMYNTRYHWNMSEEEERAEIADCVARFRRLTGRQLAGWFSPAATFTLNTPDLVAEAGIRYYCDWYHDDQPFPLKVRSGKLVTIPYQMDINDAMIWRHAIEATDFARMITDHFDVVWREGETQPRVMCVAIHPYLMGQPHRIGHLERALASILGHEGVWAATGAEIADWYIAHHLPAIEAHLAGEQGAGSLPGGGADALARSPIQVSTGHAPQAASEGQTAPGQPSGTTAPHPAAPRDPAPPRPALQPGMDHALYAWSPLPTRPPLAWPGGARVAVTVFLYLEHWELLPPADAVTDPRFRDPFGAFVPDYRTYTWREYGNRVGIFRLFEALDASGLKVTVAANAAACDAYPALVEEIRTRDWEIAAHGLHATRMLTSRMDEAAERAFIARSLDTVERATGRRPTGWIGQDYSESTRTPALLAEAGLDYVVDWPNDDQPYPMTVGRPFLSIPAQSEWDDVQLLWHRRVLSPNFPGIVSDALGRLHEEAADSGRFFGLHLHPWLAGMPHRLPHIAEAIRRVAAMPDCWRATAGEVAAHCLPRT